MVYVFFFFFLGGGAKPGGEIGRGVTGGGRKHEEGRAPKIKGGHGDMGYGVGFVFKGGGGGGGRNNRKEQLGQEGHGTLVLIGGRSEEPNMGMALCLVFFWKTREPTVGMVLKGKQQDTIPFFRGTSFLVEGN